MRWIGYDRNSRTDKFKCRSTVDELPLTQYSRVNNNINVCRWFFGVLDPRQGQ